MRRYVQPPLARADGVQDNRPHRGKNFGGVQILALLAEEVLRKVVVENLVGRLELAVAASEGRAP